MPMDVLIARIKVNTFVLVAMVACSSMDEYAANIVSVRALRSLASERVRLDRPVSASRRTC